MGRKTGPKSSLTLAAVAANVSEKELLRMLLRKHLTLKRVAKELDISRQQLWNCLKRTGLTPKYKD